MEAVERGWKCPDSITDPFQRVDALLKNTARELQSWSRRRIGQIKLQLLVAKEVVFQFDRAQDRRQLSPEEHQLRKEMKCKCLGLASLERTITRLRSRITYLREGDANTKFFHLHSSYRTKRKFISKLEDGTSLALAHDEKANLLHQHFSANLGAVPERSSTIDLQALGVQAANLQHLEYPFSEEEVWATIKALPADKSPGPDGFTAEFYKSAWPIIKMDILAAFGAFYLTNRTQLQRLNGALIMLLPKCQDPKRPGDYRPISLIHSFGKLVAKCLANRLAPELDNLVGVNQSAFIKKRSIHDNFKFVEQAARLLHRKRKPALLLKLDISKAFDTVSWPFLLQVLEALGFGIRWRDWIASLVSTASTRVLLNGDPGNLICNARGLRQGDPLSPMLFILVMEMLQRLFQRAASLGILSPPASQVIQHQCSLYADDVVLFVNPAAQDMITTKEILALFGDASGLHTNLQKSLIAPIACSDSEITLAAQLFPAEISDFPIKYLGLPLTVRRLRKAHLQPLVDRVAAYIPTWKASLLNKAGRLTLVKVTMSAACVHTLISLKVPDWVFQEIDKRRRGFLWSGKEKANGVNAWWLGPSFVSRQRSEGWEWWTFV